MSESKKLAIMQPYFLPYLGYWQLMDYVDEFVVYDDIQFVKKGWIHRNRFLMNGNDQMFSLPLKKDSDYLDVVERELAESWWQERKKLLRKFEAAYRKSPFFSEIFPIINEILNFESVNLFEFIYNSIRVIKRELKIDTDITISSKIGVTRDLAGQDRVLAICENRSAKNYVNPIGGVDLYSKFDFQKKNLDLVFHRMEDVRYKQFGDDFLPSLSILDVLMFNGISGTRDLLSRFSTI